MESKTLFIVALALFVGFALGNEEKLEEQPEPMLTTDDEQFEMENHDLRKLTTLKILFLFNSNEF